MKLCETTKFMISVDYKDRFIAEYWQTKIRYEKLKTLNTKIELSMKYGIGDASVVDCPADLLRNQQQVMGEYLHILEMRALFEEIDLEEPSND